MPASPPADAAAAAIFTKAQAVWNARSLPSYESFSLPCDQTFLADRCSAGTAVQFIVRMGDGRSFAQTIGAGGEPGIVLLRGGTMMGPAGAPFGFFRRAPVAGAAMQMAAQTVAATDPVATIASVTAVDRAYDITLERPSSDARLYYRLRLRPLRDPTLYPLRELLIERDSYRIAGLTYAQPFNTSFATVNYRFAPVGAPQFWTIVHIDASAGRQHVSQDLQNISFPQDVPAADFSP